MFGVWFGRDDEAAGDVQPDCQPAAEMPEGPLPQVRQARMRLPAVSEACRMSVVWQCMDPSSESISRSALHTLDFLAWTTRAQSLIRTHSWRFIHFTHSPPPQRHKQPSSMRFTWPANTVHTASVHWPSSDENLMCSYPRIGHNLTRKPRASRTSHQLLSTVSASKSDWTSQRVLRVLDLRLGLRLRL